MYISQFSHLERNKKVVPPFPFHPKWVPKVSLRLFLLAALAAYNVSFMTHFWSLHLKDIAFNSFLNPSKPSLVQVDIGWLFYFLLNPTTPLAACDPCPFAPLWQSPCPSVCAVRDCLPPYAVWSPGCVSPLCSNAVRMSLADTFPWSLAVWMLADTDSLGGPMLVVCHWLSMLSFRDHFVLFFFFCCSNIADALQNTIFLIQSIYFLLTRTRILCLCTTISSSLEHTGINFLVNIIDDYCAYLLLWIQISL